MLQLCKNKYLAYEKVYNRVYRKKDNIRLTNFKEDMPTKKIFNI